MRDFSIFKNKNAEITTSVKNRNHLILCTEVIFGEILNMHLHIPDVDLLFDGKMANMRGFLLDIIAPYRHDYIKKYPSLFNKSDIKDIRNPDGKMNTKTILIEEKALDRFVFEGRGHIDFDFSKPVDVAMMTFICRTMAGLRGILAFNDKAKNKLSDNFVLALMEISTFVHMFCKIYDMSENGDGKGFVMSNGEFLSDFMFKRQPLGYIVRGKDLKIVCNITGECDDGMVTGFSHHNSCKNPTIQLPLTAESAARAKYVFTDYMVHKGQVSVEIIEKSLVKDFLYNY